MRKSPSADRPASLVRRVVGKQAWHFAQRPANLSTGVAHRQNTRAVEKALLGLAAVISAVLLVAFGLDLLTGWPFHRYSLPMDTTYLLLGLTLAYLTWHTYREQH